MTPNDPNSHEPTEIMPSQTGEAVADSAPADPAPDLADLLKKAETEVADLRDAWLRARADAENTRKQAQADVANAYNYGVEKFADDMWLLKNALAQILPALNVTPQTLQSWPGLMLKTLAAAF